MILPGRGGVGSRSSRACTLISVQKNLGWSFGLQICCHRCLPCDLELKLIFTRTGGPLWTPPFTWYFRIWVKVGGGVLPSKKLAFLSSSEKGQVPFHVWLLLSCLALRWRPKPGPEVCHATGIPNSWG